MSTAAHNPEVVGSSPASATIFNVHYRCNSKKVASIMLFTEILMGYSVLKYNILK